jgi:hypothetical protein
VRTVATARLVCKAWHGAVRGAAAALECALPGNEAAAARAKLARLRALVPRVSDLRLHVSLDAAADLLAGVLDELRAFPALRCARAAARPPPAAVAATPPGAALTCPCTPVNPSTQPSPPHTHSSLLVQFSEVLELTSADVAALAAHPGLSGLHLLNVTLPSGLDLAPLAGSLTRLRALSLVQNSKVAPLLTGNDPLRAIGSMATLRELELRGRMCGVGDAGLLELRRLTRLTRLAVGWVPWQSQISQVRGGGAAGGLATAVQLGIWPCSCASGAPALAPTNLPATRPHTPQPPGRRAAPAARAAPPHLPQAQRL